MIVRPDGRGPFDLRPIEIVTGVSRFAEGSVLIRQGHTHVHITASVDERVPRWLAGGGKGWVTAEYSMLPRATERRSDREASIGKQGGRTIEIQRLIGRSLRAVVDLEALGERQVILDCDVLQADAGTRCAAITGAYVAMAIAINGLRKTGAVRRNPLLSQVAALSVGIVGGNPVVDLMYAEDSTADVDANVVMTADGQLVEVQATAEGATYSRDSLNDLLDAAAIGLKDLFEVQRLAVASAAGD